MRKKFFDPVLLLQTSLMVLLMASCRIDLGLATVTPEPSATFEMLATPILQTPTPFPSPTCPGPGWPCSSESLTLTAAMAPTLAALASETPICAWPCPSDSLTLTAAMGSTLAALPSNTPPPWATIIPSLGDLGWGSVYGKITNGVTNLPIEGATVKCEHFSSTSPYLCNGLTTTNQDGLYAFTGVFFHDTDRIKLIVEAPGYRPLSFEQTFQTRPELHADLGLFPPGAAPTFTPTPFIMCTPPACSQGVLACGNPEGCPGGCGTVCLTPTP